MNIHEMKIPGKDVVITTPNNEKLARLWPFDAANYEQATGETLYIVIGPKATDEAIRGLIERLSRTVELDLDEMKEWRDMVAKDYQP